MLKLRNITLTIILLLIGGRTITCAQVALSDNKGAFEIVSGSRVAAIYYDAEDAVVVATSAKMFADDVKAVSGRRPKITTTIPSSAKSLIIVGTIGQSAPIDALASAGKIDVSGFSDGWERYGIFCVEKPFKGIEKALVVAGSDRRGTAYGLLSISEAIGVSPWYWWADVPVEKHRKVAVDVQSYVSDEPSVKYRGIFINDEDWGLLPWATKTFEPETGSIGPKTYAKVCELLLRLKANYLCPAMHRRSVAFNEIAENKVVADTYGIVMGSVHCEPLLYNNAREWNKKVQGEWNYQTNKETINGVLRKRVEENGAYENVYTLALRGLHDKAMEGSRSFEDRKAILESALADQRQILSDVIGKPLVDIPQAFTPYKEVLDIYEKGMVLPDEVTIIWPDDNFGYLKRLSNPRERERSGRSGVYYHVSYHGKPHDYLWLCTTPPQLMYEELSKVYQTGGDRIWLLNVGDIKPCEFAMEFFLDLAYDYDSFNFENVATAHGDWLADIFGGEHREELRAIMDEYYRLSFTSKPEYMGWGFEWNTRHGKHEIVTDTDYSFANYREADRRLENYATLGVRSQQLYDMLSEEAKAAYFQLVHYPVRGCEEMNTFLLLAQKNRWYASQGRSSAMLMGEKSMASYDELARLTEEYNSLLGGKWANFMSIKHGSTAHYFEPPKLDTFTLEAKAEMGVWTEHSDVVRGGGNLKTLPTFSALHPTQTYRFDIYNKGSVPFDWSLTTSADWIVVDVMQGIVDKQQSVVVSVDWAKAPKGEELLEYIHIVGAGGSERVWVSAFNPVLPKGEQLSGLFVENGGYVSIPAADFHRKVENEDIRMTIIENLGVENRSVQMGNPLAKEQNLYERGPCLEYDFYTFSEGSVDVYTYTLPTFLLYNKEEFGNEYAGHDATNEELRYGVSIDDIFMAQPTISSHEYSQSWSENVLKNCSIKKTTMKVAGPGRHTLKIHCGDAGVVLQKIVLDFGGMKRSFVGPPTTKVE